MAGKRKNILQESIDLCEKKTPSDTIFSSIGILTGTIAGVLLIICLIVFLVAPRSYAVYAWYFLYYPSLTLVIVGLFCTSGQLIRNNYLSTIVGLIINILVAIALIIISIMQGVLYGQVLVFPFYFL